MVMLRVCHLISGDLWAGAEVMVFNLLKVLISYSGLELMVIILNEGRLAEEIRKLGIRVYVVNERAASFFQIFKAIHKIMRNRLVDIIHSHRVKENILSFLISRSIRGEIRLIGTQHGVPEDTGLKHRLNFFLLSHYFHRVVTVSKDIKETLENNYGFRKGNISVIQNGIEVQKMQRMKDNGGTFVIGSAGRLSPVKDYPFMIEISKEVQKMTNHIRFQLAGSGPEWPKLHGMIDRYSLSDVFELKGHVDNIADFYRELDLYINTSFHEGIPMSILEAMVQGIPIVAPRVGGLAEIIDDGVQGYLLDSRDRKIFAERCFELYENKSLRKNMGRAARKKIIQAFSVENMASQYCDMYYAEIH